MVFGFDTKTEGNESKNKHMELYQTKKFWTAKETSDKTKRQATWMEEHICKSGRGLISKIY